MSANLSDPAIAHACDLISDPSDATTWLLLHYSTPSSPSPIILLSSGPDPAVASLRTSVEASDEEVLFGYAEVGGKGLVLLLVSDAVGGVRRARAVVHSRAVASQLFPEYTAMITISHASELTDELVRDKLGLDYAQRRLPLVPQTDETRGVEQLGQLQQLQSHDRDPRAQGAQGQAAPISLNDEEERVGARASALPHKPRSSSSIPRATPSPSPSPALLPNQSTSGELPPAYVDADGHPLPKVPVEPISDLPLGPIDTPAASLPPLLPPNLPSQRQHHSSDQEHLAPALPLASTATPEYPPHLPNSNSNKGISSADFFPDRNRKTSLSSRLKGAIPGLTSDFGGSSNRSVSDPNAGSNSPHASHVIHGRTASGSQPRSPTASASAQDAAAAAAGIQSPESPSNKTSKFTKFFSRRRSGNNEVTPPGSPSSPRGSASASANGNGVRSDAPPVPPKDSFPAQPDRNGLFGIGDENGSPHVSNNGHNGHAQAQGYGGMSSHHLEEDRHRSLSPSQSAKVALAEARERRVAQESEIQDRFRRDQVERDRIRRHSGNRNAVVLSQTPQPEDDDDDEDVGLPYDRDPPEVPESVEGADGAEGGDRIVPSSFPHDGGVPLGHVGEKEIMPAAPTLPAAPIDAAVPNTTTTVDSGGTFGANPAERLSMAAEEHAERLKAMREEEEERVEAEKEAYRVEMQRRADEEARQAEATRLREEQEARAASEAAAMAAAEQEARLRGEEEERRIEAERMEAQRKLAEARRLEAERLEAERLEAERVAQVERERIEAERLRSEEEERARVAEQERLRAEEEARKVEEERKRREAVREGMRRSKDEGGVMLKGWITVQTFRSMTWRRRYFHLFGTEMKLFKSEGDTAPIQTIHLGQGTSVSQTYEESQVQGSFKIASKGGQDGDEDFFLFTDSPEDKETVLEGLCIAVQ